MKRLFLELFLFIAAAVAAAYAWHLHGKVATDTAKVQTMTERGEGAEKKLEEVSQALETANKELAPLRLQAQQLSAVRAALSNGVTVKDLEAAYAKEKNLSPERHLGVGVMRLLSSGQADEATVESLKKALAAADWGSRKQVICAAQNALALGGQKVEVLAECKPEPPKPATQEAAKEAPKEAAEKK
ncbi:MAG: hypothetical protein WCK08_07085 [Betaproteobacteria bacterium]